MFKAKITIGFLPILIGLMCQLGCSGAESGPVTLPVPFSGTLTADTRVLVSDGAPISSPISALKSQTSGDDTSAITWQTFDGKTGCLTGSVTFFPDTISTPEITPVTDGFRRSYTISMCADLGSGTEICSDNFQCFEYPRNDLPPTFDASDIVPEDPQAIAVTREAICSGNINSGSGDIPLDRLIDGKFVFGMIQRSDGTLQYQTQESSSLFAHGISVLPESCPAAENVLTTLIGQGFSVPVPARPDQLTNPLFLPGIALPVGDETDTILAINFISPERVEAFADVQLCNGPSCLVVHGLRIVEIAVPELNDVFANTIRMNFSEDAGFSPSILEGTVFFPTSGGGSGDHDPINCDEQSGIFAQFCRDFGPLKLNYRCTIMGNFETNDTFTIQGSWILSKGAE